MSETKKCPMCAEQIPADATFCPYCGTRFGEKAQAAPPPTAPAVVVSPPAAPVIVQPASPAFPPAKKSRIGLWIAGALVLVVILVLLGTLLWTQRANIPALSGLFTTLTPTFTPTLPPTLTPIPTATPTPHNIVVPIEEMVSSIPWLPSDPNAVPSITVLVFDTNQPPFDNLLVRQALAAAIDRQAIAQIAEEYGRKNVRPATSFTPAITLGLDLYEQVGIPFDPDRARILLSQAGYANGINFPPITIYTNPAGFRVPIVNAVVDMWKTVLTLVSANCG